MTTQALTAPPALAFVEAEIDRAQSRLERLEGQRDGLLEQRQAAIAAAGLAADAITAEERRRSGISASEPSPFRLGIFIESAQGIGGAMAHRAGGARLDAALASDQAFRLTQQLDALGRLIGAARRELAQRLGEENAARAAAGRQARDWVPMTAKLLSKPDASTGGIG